jgi:hypothetical protein
VAARARGSKLLPWARKKARYRSEAERAEVVKLYESAKRVYAGM